MKGHKMPNYKVQSSRVFSKLYPAAQSSFRRGRRGGPQAHILMLEHRSLTAHPGSGAYLKPRTATNMLSLACWKSRVHSIKLLSMTTIQPDYSSFFNLPQKRGNSVDLHPAVAEPELVANRASQSHAEQVQDWISRGAEQELVLQGISSEEFEELSIELEHKGTKVRQVAFSLRDIAV